MSTAPVTSPRISADRRQCHHHEAGGRLSTHRFSTVTFRRRCLAGEGLVDRDVLGVAVGNLPLTVLAAEDVSDAQGVRLDQDTNDRICDVFEADYASHLPADVSGQQIEAALSGPGPLPRTRSRHP